MLIIYGDDGARVRHTQNVLRNVLVIITIITIIIIININIIIINIIIIITITISYYSSAKAVQRVLFR